MLELKHINRLLCTALAAALLVGCASKEPQGPQITLQDPEQTPREKWSDAMKILRDDLNIKGQKDVPAETARQYGLITRVGEPARGNGGGFDNLVTGIAGSQSPPTGFSSGAALGMGVFLFMTPTGKATESWESNQVAAWVPIEKASSMEEAIQVVIDTWNKSRGHAFNEMTTIKVYPSVVADFAKGQFTGPKDMLLKTPAPPSGGPVNGPSFAPTGRYYGPIFLSKFSNQIWMDADRNNIERDKAMRMLSSQLPNWFVIYNKGQRKAGSIVTTSFPPSVLVAGKEHFFVGK
jgi:hypothetical protein